MFTINPKETDELRGFLDAHKGCKCTDAMCQKYEYRFYPGGIGTTKVVKCLICGEEKNYTDIDCW